MLTRLREKSMPYLTTEREVTSAMLIGILVGGIIVGLTWILWERNDLHRYDVNRDGRVSLTDLVELKRELMQGEEKRDAP